MRKLFTLLGAAATVLLLLTSCEKKGKEPDEIVSKISVSPTELSFSATAETKSVSVTANADWTANCAESWVTLGATSGSGDTSLNISVGDNSSAAQRSATVTFKTKDGKATANLTVNQDAAGTLLSVSPSELSFSATAETKSVSVTANADWTANCAESWVTLGATSGSGDASIGISAAENTATASRTATVTFTTDDGKSTASVKLTQEGADVVFSIDRSEVSVAAEGGEFTVKVTSNIGYKIDSKPEWVEQKSKSTSGNVDTYIYAAKANTAPSAREGTIVFCNENEVCIPVTVKQAAGKADDEEDSSSWAGRDFYHKSLGMRFTATWCGYCPIMAESFKLAQSKYPNKIELLNLHASTSNLAFSGTATLANQFSVTGYPTGIVDYRTKIANYDSNYASTLIVNAAKETEAKYPTLSGISFTSSVSGTRLSVDVKLYIKEKGDYKLAVVLLEDGIVGYQNGGGENYHHDGIARLAVSDIKGDAFSTSADNKTVSKQYSATLSTGWDKSNLRVLVYVLKSYGSRSVISSGSYGNYYVDNAISAPVGTELKLTFTDGSTLSGGNEDTTDGGEIILN